MSLVPKHIQKLAPYKPGMHIETAKKKYGIKNIIKLASNENPLGPSKEALKKVENTLINNHRYPDSYALLLREKLSKKFSVDIENVILGSGSEGIMSTIMRTFLNKNDEIIGVKNSFIGFRVLANASGNVVRWANMNKYKYNLNSILDLVNDKTKIIYLANPDNPTGSYFSKKDFDDFMPKIPSRVLVIMDEAYYEYASYCNDYPDSMQYRYDNVITLRTFSKSYGLAGLRIGYGFAHHDIINNLMKVKLPFEPSIPAQEAAMAAMDDLEHVEKTIDVNRIGFKHITKKLNELNIDFIPSVTNFITLIFESKNKSIQFTDFMLQNGIIVRHLESFGLSECVRVTIGTQEENNQYLNILKKFKKING